MRKCRVKGFEVLAQLEPLIAAPEGFKTVRFDGFSLLNGRIPPYYKIVKIEDIEEIIS